MLRFLFVVLLTAAFLRADELQDALEHFWNGEYHSAQTLFKKLSDGGSAEAAYRLGNMYEFGVGVGMDNHMAHEYYRLAANRGDSVSMYIVAMHHFRGRGAVGSMDECVSWLKKAARKGNRKAAYTLGYFYEHGTGALEVSRYRANYWYKIAKK